MLILSYNMEELLDMITADKSPSQISDKIKELLFSKSVEKIDGFRPSVSQSLFGDESELDYENEEEE